MSVLVKYEEARQALATCASIDEAKDMHDKAEAIRAYSRQANDTEMEQHCAEIKLRAQRRIGELSAVMEKAKPAGGSGIVVRPPCGQTKTESLADAGLTRQQANRFEQIAAIPEPEFEEVIAEAKAEQRPVKAADVLERSPRRETQHRATTPKPASKPEPKEPPPAWSAVATELARIASLIDSTGPIPEEEKPWELVKAMESAGQSLLHRARELRKRHHL